MRRQKPRPETAAAVARYQPFAFAERGAIMAATILNRPRAVEMSIYVRQTRPHLAADDG